MTLCPLLGGQSRKQKNQLEKAGGIPATSQVVDGVDIMDEVDETYPVSVLLMGSTFTETPSMNT